MATATVQIGTLAAGTKLNFTIGGIVRDCYILNQGRPTDQWNDGTIVYDSSCDGTWVTMDDPPLAGLQWNTSSPATYAGSSMHSYLNSTFYNSIESNVRNNIKQVKIPYWTYSYDPYGNVNYGSSGLSCKVFLLSYAEVDHGGSISGPGLIHDGVPVDFVPNHYLDDPDTLKYSWTRTGLASTDGSPATQARFYSTSGLGGSADVTSGPESYSSIGTRPTFILPSTFQVTVEVPNTAPSTPGALTITPTPIMGGDFVSISWGASTDAEGGTISYALERRLDGGSWDIRNSVVGVTTSGDTVPAGTGTVQYRVYAMDTAGLASGYRTSSTFTVVNNAAPATPGVITFPSAIKGGNAFTISWGASTDADGNLSGYKLERAINGGTSWSQIYQGTTASVSDTAGTDWTSVKYRVKAYDSYGAESSYRTGSNLTVTQNSPPTVPAKINVPSDVRGGAKLSITWTASTDPDAGNTVGYKLERSLNGGTAWTQIYQGNNAAYDDTITFGWTTVMYRVKAYDNEDAESAYRTSSTFDVINNTSPTAVATLNVPTEIKGGKAHTVTWTASTDAQGNLSGYKLERNLNNAEWTLVYTGTNLSYTDTVALGTTTVAYRVKAYDSYDAESSYTTSPTRTVNNNQPAAIASPSMPSGSTTVNLGAKTEGFSITYTVTDPNAGDTVTVTEKIDSTVIRTYTATLGQAAVFDITGLQFMKVLNGNHTATIAAIDAQGEGVTFSFTFSKAIYACSITLAAPLESDELIVKTVISVMSSIPSDANFSVFLTNNAKDAAPVWEDATSIVLNGFNHIFANTTVVNGHAYNFQITASRGASGQGGWIESIGGAYE
jgi:hypothetical protein